MGRYTPIMTSFWKRLNYPKFISAPMVDHSSLAFRLLTRSNGADLCFTQMMHARNFLNDRTYRRDCIDWVDYSNTINKEQWASNLDRPLIGQLAGDDSEVLVQAGRILLDTNITAIDLNLGCPQKIARRGHYGGYLLKEPDLVISLLSNLVDRLPIPITAKIRKLDTIEDTIQLARRIEACGVQMLTLHGRTVEASKLFTGPADWDVIRAVKQSVSIPVVANGGISCRDDALRCLEYTGADAVMSSEALLENPKLFNEQGDRLYRENFAETQLQTVKEYIHLVKSFPLPQPTNQVIRCHLFKMLFRFLNARLNVDLREQLSEAKYEEMFEVVKVLEERICGKTTDQLIEEGYLQETSWYMRHRDERAQRRVLSLPKSFSRTNKEQGMDALCTINAEGKQAVTVDLEAIKEERRQRIVELKERMKQRQAVRLVLANESTI